MKVPFMNLKLQYESIASEISLAINSVLNSTQYIQGPYVENFSKEFLAVHGGNYAVACSSGTSALLALFKSLGVGAGDEVVMPVNTFFATAEAAIEVGAKVYFVDIDPDTYLMNLNDLEFVLRDKNIKCIVPVHLYGNPVNMNEVVLLAKKYGAFVLEDCAQAHLALYDEQAVGTFGDGGTFSFYPGKNLGAYGDAGLIISQTKNVADYCSMYINHGRVGKYQHEFVGNNYRCDGIQGAILSVKLKYLKKWTEKRIKLAKLYDSYFKELGIKTIKVNERSKCVYHLYVIEVDDRDKIQLELERKGIKTGVHYPIPLHLQPALRSLCFKKNDFPIAERVSHKILSLPLFPEMKESELEYVVECMKALINTK